jgi:hypothetical protein
MATKTTMTLLALGLAVLAGAACKTPRSSTSFQRAITAADSIIVYQIEAFPTLSSEQQTGRYYLHGYAVGGRQVLAIEDMQAMQAILLDVATFDSAAVKSCPMIAKMALDFRHKGKSQATLVMSKSPCGKAVLFEAAKPKAPRYMELATGNRLEPLVFGVWK